VLGFYDTFVHIFQQNERHLLPLANSNNNNNWSRPGIYDKLWPKVKVINQRAMFYLLLMAIC